MLSLQDVYRQISQVDTEPVVLLETNRKDANNTKSLFFIHPETVLSTNNLDEVTSVLISVDKAIGNGYYAAGYISYEAGFAFEPALKAFHENTRFDKPLIWFGIFSKPHIINSEPHSTDSISNRHDTEQIPEHEQYSVSNLTFSLSENQYRKDIRQIKDYISSGDTYQINHTWPVYFDFSGDICSFYRQLKRNQPVSYTSYINHDDITVLSLSPELFFRRNNSRLTTKPMKGTVHRGKTVQEDRALAVWLAESEKNRAENIMIVDMLRNDMGRICNDGSIQVPEMFSVEKFNTLFQMTSTIHGELRDNTVYADIFGSLFPCGSVTGAPKIRSMEIIHELERTQRGIYTGAIGYISPHKEAVFNVAIRTITLRSGKGTMGIGSGIVWDSETENEYDECKLKMRFLSQSHVPFKLIETMLYKEGAFPLLDLHMKRLEESAEYFDYVFNRESIIDQLVSFSTDIEKNMKYKVRLLLNRDGHLHLEKSELVHLKERRTKTIVLSSVRTNSEEHLLYHKTTKRELYTSMYEIAQKNGFYDIIFMNERDEITEGCIHNVFIKMNGKLVTPPLSSGLLNGVKRRDILRNTENTEERVITLDDICNAEEIYICNAVRGMLRVSFIPVLVHEDGSLSNL